MELESTSLFREVLSIINSSAKPVHYKWSAQFHVGEGQKETYEAMKVLSVDFVYDYEDNIGEVVMLTCLVPGGTYAKRIYPSQSNMDITLTRVPIGEVNDSVDEQSAAQSERYTATLVDKGNPLLESNGGAEVNEQTLNITSMTEVSFQLVNKAVEQLRMISIGGIFRQCTVEDVIRDTLTRESQAVKVEKVRMPQGVDMVKASNQQQRDHVIIPHGLRLVDLPNYVHNRCGGVYNAGMGYFMQGDWWYVYPCYDTTRFNQALRTLTVINLPSKKMPSLERTYRCDGKNTVVLATGEVRMRDDTDAQQLNSGNGVRFADANKFMDGFSETRDNTTVLSRGANASEFISAQRPNGINQVKMSQSRITANPFVEFSLAARRQGSFISFVWENSDPSLVFPGMMVKVLYMKENELMETYGVVLKAHHFVSLKGQGLVATRYQTTSSISLFVKGSTVSQ